MLQIENREDEYNPYAHSPQDNIAHMNLDYWVEQIKVTIAATAYLAVPSTTAEQVFLPLMFTPYVEEEKLDPQSNPRSDHWGCQSRPER